MKHELNRDPSSDGIGIRGYKDENGGTWLCISKEDGRKVIYSGMCLLTSELNIEEIISKQPNLENVKALEGVYRDSEAPNEHPTYTFYEKNGRLYMRDGNEKIHFLACISQMKQEGAHGLLVILLADQFKFNSLQI